MAVTPKLLRKATANLFNIPTILLIKTTFFDNPLDRYENITNDSGIRKPAHKVANKVA